LKSKKRFGYDAVLSGDKQLYFPKRSLRVRVVMSFDSTLLMTSFFSAKSLCTCYDNGMFSSSKSVDLNPTKSGLDI